MWSDLPQLQQYLLVVRFPEPQNVQKTTSGLAGTGCMKTATRLPESYVIEHFLYYSGKSQNSFPSGSLNIA